MKDEFQDITVDTKRLISGEEGYDVDFKIEGLDSEDIVAFANSKNGGVILIGVDEIKDSSGKVHGRIVGTKIGDSEKLKIINKGLDCSPPIQLKITYENVSEKPIIRVEIPSGQYKPYCTKKGVYKIRNDGRNQALSSDQLFEIFLEREYKNFIDKFKEATKELRDELNNIAEQLEITEFRITNTLEDIGSKASEAEFNSSEGQSTSEGIYFKLKGLEEKIFDIESSIEDSTERELLILEHLGLEDPRITRLTKTIKNHIEKKLIEAKTAKKRPIKKKIIDDIVERIKGFKLNVDRIKIEEIYNSIKV